MITQKIFFSYSRADGSDFALKLALDLKKKGFDAWIDQEDIRAGLEWDIEIEKALQTCDCLLFIETEKSVISNNVLDEVYYALEQKKKVIPLIFVDSKTPFRLQRLQHIDFTKDYNSALSLLINELEAGHSAGLIQPKEDKSLDHVSRSFYAKYSRLILLIVSIVIVIAAVVIYTAKHNNATPSGQLELSKDSVTGEWELVDVDPKARLKRGYLKIEAIDEKKVTIKSSLQFYYFKTNETSFLTVFNAFAGCASCLLAKDMKITAEDVAVGSRIIKILKEDQPGGKKAGDTLTDASLNKSIKASVTLQLVNNATAVVKVQRSTPVALADELTLEPFVYSFVFRKLQ